MNAKLEKAGMASPRLRGGKTPHRLRELLHRLLHYANRNYTRQEFLRSSASLLLEFSSSDAAEIRVEEGQKVLRCRAILCGEGAFRFDCENRTDTRPEDVGRSSDSTVEEMLKVVLKGQYSAAAPNLTRTGSFWTGDSARPVLLREEGGHEGLARSVVIGGEFQSLALLPVPVDDHSSGVLFLGSRRRDFFSKDDVQFYEAVAETVGVALAYQRAQWALRERVKELTCLYEIASIAQRPGIALESLLAEIVEILPPGWQYPELTVARILLDGKVYDTRGFRETGPCQVAEIVANGRSRGSVEVRYTDERPPIDEGPFLAEERSLINEIARQLGLILERRETEEERNRLEEQLRHADRLATIGQLSAGTAHELNEPLGGILGFAQLAKSCPKLPPQAEQDLDRIVNAALHAREIIKKLMIFSRQMPTRKSAINLNHLVQEGLYFIESRCAKEGIQLVRHLDGDLKPITADPSQLHQVLVNLCVNAAQAMQGGGTLTIRTASGERHVALVVEDTGVGMDEETLKQIFIPFFTTKDVGQGTGLGLAVVHGIVTSHGGTIGVESTLGKGSRFEVKLPIGDQNESVEVR